uniref:Uncharacterized protein n=1 Tax=Anguilla anguilla TaxID=7936 RepID=A0A0E9UH59_ANGAN
MKKRKANNHEFNGWIWPLSPTRPSS